MVSNRRPVGIEKGLVHDEPEREEASVP